MQSWSSSAYSVQKSCDSSDSKFKWLECKSFLGRPTQRHCLEIIHCSVLSCSRSLWMLLRNNLIPLRLRKYYEIYVVSSWWAPLNRQLDIFSSGQSWRLQRWPCNHAERSKSWHSSASPCEALSRWMLLLYIYIYIYIVYISSIIKCFMLWLVCCDKFWTYVNAATIFAILCCFIFVVSLPLDVAMGDWLALLFWLGLATWRWW